MKKRVTAVFLMMAILISSCFVFRTSANAASSTLENQKNARESELAKLKKDKEAIAKSLAEAKSKTNEQARAVELMYEEIEICQQEIDTISALIDEYFALAKEKEQEIEEITARMKKNFEYFSRRFELAQLNGNITMIDYVLGSDGPADIISRTEQIKYMFEYDKKLLESLNNDKLELEAAKQEINDALDKCSEQKAEYETKVAELNEKIKEADAFLAQLKEDQNKQQEYYDALAKQTAAKEKELDNINARIKAENEARAKANIPSGNGGGNSGNGGNGNTGNGGGNTGNANWHGIWPVSNAYKNAISQYFKGSAHSGLDIHTYGVRNRVPALSVLAGTVVRTGMYASWGNLVVVQHDNGYQTYYAHLDTILVSNGQRVSQGQQVGLVGSTGNSTGAHLHFCVVTPGGVRVDPLPYIN